MGDLHFLNWVRLVVFVFFASVTVDDRRQGPMGWNEERREAVGFLGFGSWGFFDGNIGR
jgi:hypothetical protein